MPSQLKQRNYKELDMFKMPKGQNLTSKSLYPEKLLLKNNGIPRQAKFKYLLVDIPEPDLAFFGPTQQSRILPVID